MITSRVVEGIQRDQKHPDSALNVHRIIVDPRVACCGRCPLLTGCVHGRYERRRQQQRQQHRGRGCAEKEQVSILPVAQIPQVCRACKCMHTLVHDTSIWWAMLHRLV